MANPNYNFIKAAIKSCTSEEIATKLANLNLPIWFINRIFNGIKIPKETEVLSYIKSKHSTDTLESITIQKVILKDGCQYDALEIRYKYTKIVYFEKPYEFKGEIGTWNDFWKMRQNNSYTSYKDDSHQYEFKYEQEDNCYAAPEEFEEE